ncbi:hypothetical protein BH10PSE18_BH10PSE18_08400 [soil metagenome]
MVNAMIVVAICVLFPLSFVLSDDLALLPGIPLLILIVLLPLGIIYGVITLIGVMRDRNRARKLAHIRAARAR